MAGYTTRRQRRLFGPRIAIVAGIIVALIGIYFMVGISGSTNRKNAECTEEIVGTIIESVSYGSSYKTTVEYTPGYSPMTVTYTTKKQYVVGTEIPVKYKPDTFSRVYIEGMTPTGIKDIIQGAEFILGGVVLAAVGFLLEKMRRK